MVFLLLFNLVFFFPNKNNFNYLLTHILTATKFHLKLATTNNCKLTFQLVVVLGHFLNAFLVYLSVLPRLFAASSHLPSYSKHFNLTIIKQ